MAEFRETLARLGLGGIATHIQSGNAVFRAAGKPADLASQISEAIMRDFGFQTDVLVLSESALAAAIKNNPFPDAENDPANLYLHFAFDAIDPDEPKALSALATQGERFRVLGRVLYLHAPGGVGRSNLAARLTRLITTPMSARNLRSCRKILDLAHDMRTT